ncbi:MAG: UDP-3-O-acyl-N-acetylglucosamine deacetylase, partial [Candidatus Omnitrophota bacterium]
MQKDEMNGVQKQRTLRGPVTVTGTGLQTGNKASLTLQEAPADSGINFIRNDLPNKPCIHIQSFNFDDFAKDRRSTVGFEGAQVQTVEHLMAALSALSIDNIVIELNGEELPGLDGSAQGYFDALKNAGYTEQDAPKKEIILESPVWHQVGETLLAAFPYFGLKLSCMISYKDPSIGTQYLSLEIDESVFENEIAPARTFCLKKEAITLLEQGFGKGANYENTLVMGKNGPINNTLRFPDEPVRHKMLDLLGDLYLTGYRLRAHVVAIRSGHRHNFAMV